MFLFFMLISFLVYKKSIFLSFFHENIKKLPSKVGYLSKLEVISFFFT